MSIHYQDFMPQVVKRNLLNIQYEELPEMVERVNQWIDRHGIDVINVETVLISAENVREGFQLEAQLHGLNNEYYKRLQVIRVWFR